MNIAQPIEGMTWGDLRAFVALGADLANTEKVELEYDDRDGSVDALAIWGIPAWMVHLAPKPGD